MNPEELAAAPLIWRTAGAQILDAQGKANRQRALRERAQQLQAQHLRR